MPETLIQMLLDTILSFTAYPATLLLQVVILFFSLSMLLYDGEQVWTTVTRTLSPKLSAAVGRMSEVAGNTIYSLIVIQISADSSRFSSPFRSSFFWAKATCFCSPP